MPAYLAILVAFFGIKTQARWANFNEATYVVNFEHVKFDVARDGSHEIEVERQTEILQDAARTSQGLARLTYSATDEFKLLEARTINGKKSISVPPKSIEIKPLASSGPGFDLTNQVTIAYPQVDVGSKLYLKYKKRISKPKVPGMFFGYYIIGYNEYIQDYSVRIKLLFPFVHQLADTEDYIEINRQGQTLTFKLKRPIIRLVLEEDNVAMDPRSFIWIGVTSLKSWAELPVNTIAAYASQIAAPVPPKFSSILEKARAIASPTEQLNYVTSQLAEQMRYVGDWRTVHGAYHPHKVMAIAQSGYGDCKDFSTAAGNLLDKLGFEVLPAWVYRGRDWIPSPLSIPIPDFNHAILWAKKAEQEYFIDATNLTSFAQGIYNDIADRPALVLKKGASEVKHIPPQSPEKGAIHMKINVAFRDMENIDGSGEFLLGGHAAVSMTGGELSSSKKMLDFNLIQWLLNPSQMSSWEVGEYSLKSRIVKDFTAPFRFKETWRPIITSAGHGYFVPTTPYSMFNTRLAERVSDLRLEDPVTWRREYHFTGKEIELRQEFNCSGQSPWADFSRSLTRSNTGASLIDTIRLKTTRVKLQDLKSPHYSNFRTKFLNCLQEAVIVFTK